MYGTFMHYILENVTREVKENGGFRQIDEERCRALTRRYVNSYAERELGGLGGKKRAALNTCSGASRRRRRRSCWICWRI